MQSADGRPVTRFFAEQGVVKDSGVIWHLWIATPPQDGDPVYFDGVEVGTFGGTYPHPPVKEGETSVGSWYIEVYESSRRPEAMNRIMEKISRKSAEA